MSKLNSYEIEVLEMLAGTRPAEWGAWVSVCLETLAAMGLCTRGPHFRITPAGLAALEQESGR